MRYEKLRKIAIYGAVASISGSFILHHFTQGNCQYMHIHDFLIISFK